MIPSSVSSLVVSPAWLAGCLHLNVSYCWLYLKVGLAGSYIPMIVGNCFKNSCHAPICYILIASDSPSLGGPIGWVGENPGAGK